MRLNHLILTWISAGLLLFAAQVAAQAISDENQNIHDIELTFKFYHPSLHYRAYQSTPFFTDTLQLKIKSGEKKDYTKILNVRFPGSCKYVSNVSLHQRPFDLEIDVEHNLPDGIGEVAIRVSSPNEMPGWKVFYDEIHILVGPEGANETRGIVYYIPEDINIKPNCNEIEMTGYILISHQPKS